MKYIKKIRIVIIFLLVSGSPLSSNAQHVLQTSVFGSGGGITDNANLLVNCTLGQTGVGLSDNANYMFYGGFWFSADQITVVEEDELGLPEKFDLFQNYPNPFNPTTTIKYGVPEAAHVRIELFNLLGQQVSVLLDEDKTVGYYTLEFHANGLASGIYLYRMISNNFIQTKKFMLLK